MSYGLLGCQLILAAVMGLAAMSKLFSPRDIITALQKSNLPGILAYPAALFLIISELELALGLIFGNAWSLFAAFAGTFLLLSIFTFWLIVVYRQKPGMKCGCFGASNTTVSSKSIIRNSAFMGLAILGGFFTHLSPSLLPPPSTWTLAFGIILAGGALVLFLARLNITSVLINNPSLPDLTAE
jgi:ribose/xylose/arabinose/galactoside ABC-type transport system permease subunit